MSWKSFAQVSGTAIACTAVIGVFVVGHQMDQTRTPAPQVRLVQPAAQPVTATPTVTVTVQAPVKAPVVAAKPKPKPVVSSKATV